MVTRVSGCSTSGGDTAAPDFVSPSPPPSYAENARSAQSARVRRAAVRIGCNWWREEPSGKTLAAATRLLVKVVNSPAGEGGEFTAPIHRRTRDVPGVTVNWDGDFGL